MKRDVVVATLLVVIAAGCAGPRSSSDQEPAPGVGSARLVGGAAHTGDPAVVVLEVDGQGNCTAEFISTTVLLTAAHCVLTDSGKPMPTSTFRIHRGPDIHTAQATEWITIDPADVHPHPSFQDEEHDVAVLVLKEPVDVTPLAWSTSALSATDVGKAVRLVGYGANVPGEPEGDDGFGIKRQLTTTIAKVDPHFVQVGKAGQTACGGDSGGPAIVDVGGVETIIGLDSYSDAEVDCTEGEYYQRVDTEAAFIATYLSPASVPAAPGAEPPGDGKAEEPRGGGGSKDPPAAVASPQAGSCSVSPPRSAPHGTALGSIGALGLAAAWIRASSSGSRRRRRGR